MLTTTARRMRSFASRLSAFHLGILAVFLLIFAFFVVGVFLLGAAVVSAAGDQTWLGWVMAAFSLVALGMLAALILGFYLVAKRLLRQTNTISAELSGALNTARPDNSRVTRATGSVWYWTQQVRTTPGQLSFFSDLAKRRRLEGARDVLSYAATDYQFDFQDLGGLLESVRTGTFRREAEEKLKHRFWRPGLISLAQVLYAQRRNEMDLLDALTLYDLLARWHGRQTITGHDQSYYADLLTWRGRFEDARQLIDKHPAGNFERAYSQQFLRLNTLNPAQIGTTEHAEEWLRTLNDLLSKSDLAPVHFKNPQAPSFFGLECDAPQARVSNAPLVSVIMPIYEPDEATDLAIESLLNQTWPNIEILVMDDASPTFDKAGNATNYRSRLEAWAERDARVKVTFCPENRGAYAVRNDGYDLAQGEFITVADKDDWHHPQKIERQVTELISNPKLPANLVNWTRVDEDMRFLLRWGPDRVIHPSFASLMFRTEQIRETLGYWDTVRKSADGEFKLRFQAVYGVDLQPTIKAPLAFSLLGDGNLTSADYGIGFRHEDRHAYQRAYQAWHRQIEAGKASPYMPKHPDQRKFPAPARFLPARPSGPLHYDIVYLSEFGFEAGNSTILKQELDACLGAGLKVGVIPTENGLIASASRRHIVPPLEEYILDGRVERVALDTALTTDLLLIRWPASLQANPGIESRIDAKKIVVVSNHMPYEVSGHRRSYDIRTVSENIERTFGKRPTWTPESERVGAFLKPLVPPGEMAPFTWKGIVEPLEPVSRGYEPGRRPVIGRHARDDEGKWPSSKSEFLSAYPIDGSVSVSILGGANVPVRQGHLPKDLPESWTVYGFNKIPVSEYLQGLDFFVYFHSKGLVEAFGMAIVEAMNNGVVCVLPPHFEPVFKDAAVYAEAADVPEVIRTLWNEDTYAAQQERGYAFIKKECSPDAYRRRLTMLGVGQ